MCDNDSGMINTAITKYLEERKMKKILALLLVVVMVVSLVACAPAATNDPTDGNKDTTGETNGSTEGGDTTITDPDKIADEMTSADGKYQVAFITDVGQLKDKSFNQGTYDGVKLYAANNGKSYKYYQPANGDTATDEDQIGRASCRERV